MPLGADVCPTLYWLRPGISACTVIVAVFGGGRCVRAADIPALVRQHDATLSQIRSYHFRITTATTTEFGESPGAEAVTESVVEIWREGPNRREQQRIYRISSPNGEKVVDKPHGRVIDLGVDDREVRLLDGWDPEHPFQLPLEFGRDAAEFGSVKGTIAVRDPTREFDQIESVCLLWRIVPRMTLAKLAENAELVEVPTTTDGLAIVRCRLQSSSHPELSKEIGTTFDFDLQHGGMISRVEQSTPEIRRVYEVLDFTPCGPALPELWWPTRVRLTMTVVGREMRQVTDWSIDRLDVNEPIAAEILRLDFPEGCRVDESLSHRIHIWGKGEPAATFTTHAAFQEYLYARAREYQSRNVPKSTTNFRPEPNVWAFLIVNGGLVAVLVGLTIFRRRLARQTAESTLDAAGGAVGIPDATSTTSPDGPQ